MSEIGKEETSVSLVVLGSIALDTIETERGMEQECLGGSASHASLAASYFTRPRLVGVVGDDFPQEYQAFLANRMDISELEVLTGKTFRWHGAHNLATGHTEHKATHLNTYESFKPLLGEASSASTHVLLGNIDPNLQLHVLDQLRATQLVACDTMSLWIEIAKEKVIDVMRRVDLFLINETESYELTERSDVKAAGEQMLQWGARRVIIKCGGRPAHLYGDGVHREIPTVAGVDVTDPTGAGDNFAGAMMGYMAQNGARADDLERLTRAMSYGSAVASYAIESFGTRAHERLSLEMIERRSGSLSPAG